MSDPSALDRLCARCGIDVEFVDIWGERHVVPDDTKRSLLGAMNIDAGCADPERVLEEIEARGWRRMLAPVQVLLATEKTPRTELSLRSAQAGTVFSWRLTLESGAIIGGECKPIDPAGVGERK